MTIKDAQQAAATFSPNEAPTQEQPLLKDVSRKPRGFATLDKARMAEISRKGGRAAHALGRAHQFTPEEARIAGRKGGRVMHANKRARMAAGQ